MRVVGPFGGVVAGAMALLVCVPTSVFARNCYTFVNASSYQVSVNLTYSWPVPDGSPQSIDLEPGEGHQFCYEDGYPKGGSVYADPLGGAG